MYHCFGTCKNYSTTIEEFRSLNTENVRNLFILIACAQFLVQINKLSYKRFFKNSAKVFINKKH